MHENRKPTNTHAHTKAGTHTWSTTLTVAPIIHNQEMKISLINDTGKAENAPARELNQGCRCSHVFNFKHWGEKENSIITYTIYSINWKQVNVLTIKPKDFRKKHGGKDP